jgi:hypothetical protein
MSHNRVSIIVPCYNQAAYLPETLQSVIDQTYQDWECIIINDGSTDDTAAVASLWLKKDIRFKYIYKKNGGLSSARNMGLDAVSGKYIQFLDSDDTIAKNKLQLQLVDLVDCDISICDYFPLEDKAGTRFDSRYITPFTSVENYKKQIILDWETNISIPCHCVLFKKKIIDSFSIKFDESLCNHEDWLFWSKLFYHSAGINNNYKIMAIYRIRESSMSTDYKLMREGFENASQKMISYFENLEDMQYADYSKLKLQLIRAKNKKICAKKEPLSKIIKRIIRKLM